ncbi:hypothetical protein J2Y55_002956 [Bosea sp. BE125]|uniref:SapC family protein n=1 Tax=Bosea sp. BE125 TaxID=2817909 RepID=UPI00285D1A70|nr:SapC family protein [Bosea sp. BE125]MDR6871943.1 hypothetical protein [Bosea sp. BE125]
MAPLPLFYTSIVVLDRNIHRDARIAPAERGYAFAAGSHVVPALMAEFVLGCRDMPILFLEEAGSVSPLFMVGMRSGENDFVEAGGRWNGVHAPAYLRRYPFIGGEVSQEQQVICLDGSYAGLQDQAGERLFNEAGEPSEMLQRAVTFVGEYADAAKATGVFTAELKALDLFQTVNIDIRSPTGLSSSFSGFLAVSEERFNALPDDVLADLRRKGYLAPIYAHLISLGNFGALGDRAGARATAAAAAEAA